MDPVKIVKSYFLKVALPIIIITAFCDSLMTPGSFLSSKLANIVVAGSG